MKKIVISFICFTLLYLIASYILLNEKLTYWTSFNESTIPDSKKEKLFITDKLEIETKGDSLSYWNEKFNIWTNKRYEIKYYGVLFYWTFENDKWRYLNIKPKKDYIENSYFRKKIKVNQYERDYMKEFTGGYENCCNRISCEVGDTVTVEFMEWKNNTILGEIKTVIK